MIVDLRLPICDLQLKTTAPRPLRAFRSQIANRKLKIGGYSFPEVLFAVVVLGIGFIMIAAIFPVAISQNKITMDETTATAVSRAGVNIMSQLAYDPRATLPPPLSFGVLLPTCEPLISNPQPPFIGQVYPIDSRVGWETVKNNLIFSDDHRFACVPIYRRDGNRNAVP